MKLSKDLAGGLIFTMIGAFILVEAQRYQLGTLAHMGPGYYPSIVGALMTLVGVWVLGKPAVMAILARSTPADLIGAVNLRALVFLLGAIVLFAVTVDRLGLLPAIVILIVTARFGSSQPLGWKATALLAVALAATSAIVFWYFLGLPFRLGV